MMAVAVPASRDAWFAALPEHPTVGQSAQAMREALAYGEAAIDQAKATFQGGMLPPPPWPATPGLLDALKDCRTVIDAMAVFESRVPDAKVPADKVAKGVQVGLRVFDEADKLLGRAHVVAERSPTVALAEAKAYAKKIRETMSMGKLALVVLVLWLLYEQSEG